MEGHASIPLRFARLRPTGFPVGRKQGLHFCISDHTEFHCCILGATGGGKTSTLLIPLIEHTSLPTFAIDVKGDMVEVLKNHGVPFRVLNVNGEEWGYNPFFFVDPKTARKDIGIIVQSILPTVNDEDFWTKSARVLLQGMLLYYYRKDHTFAQACRDILSSDLKQQVKYAMLESREVAPLLSNLEGLNDRTFTCISATLATALAVFTEDEIQRVMSQPPERCVSPADLLSGINIVLRLPEDSLEFFSKYLQLLCGQLFLFFERQPDGHQPKVNVVIDEVYRIGKLQTLQKAVATLRSKGVRITIACQSYAQLEELYGANGARVLVDNFTYQAILGATDPTTQNYYAAKAGTVEQRRDNFTHSGTGRLINSYHWESRPAIQPDELALLPRRNKLIFFFPGGWMELNKNRPYYWSHPLVRLWRSLCGGKPNNSGGSVRLREESEERAWQAKHRPEPAASSGAAAPKPPELPKPQAPLEKGGIQHGEPQTQQGDDPPVDGGRARINVPPYPGQQSKKSKRLRNGASQ